MNQDSEIFNKLTDVERDRLFRDLADVHGEIVCKGDSDDLYRLKVERIGPNKELYCMAPHRDTVPKSETDLLGNFFLGGERYFFRTPAEINQEFITLRADRDVFHLQRRQNYRIKIPLNFRALLGIQKVDGRAVKLNAEILDLSTGGCRAQLKATEMLMAEGIEIDGILLIADRDAIPVKGIVRHRTQEATAANAKQKFGIEFLGMTAPLETKLFSITMDLHRQLFARLNKKP